MIPSLEGLAIATDLELQTSSRILLVKCEWKGQGKGLSNLTNTFYLWLPSLFHQDDPVVLLQSGQTFDRKSIEVGVGCPLSSLGVAHSQKASHILVKDLASLKGWRHQIMYQKLWLSNKIGAFDPFSFYVSQLYITFHSYGGFKGPPAACKYLKCERSSILCPD